MTVLRVLPIVLIAALALTPVHAAEIGPPMFDVARQCDAASRRNATAMSECVVAESEARSEILQGWSKVADGDAERCVKLGRKAKRRPYSAIAACLAAATPGAAATPRKP